MAYASEHLSLAALELFVHVVDLGQPSDLVAVQAEFPLTEQVQARMQAAIRRRLPGHWRDDIELTRRIGGEFLAAAESAILLVPSVVVDIEWNILLNPEHADIAKLKVLSAKPFRFDPRMFHR